MRTVLHELEKQYIKENIFRPMEGDLSKIGLFGTVERARNMLLSALGRVKYDKKSFEAGIDSVVGPNNSIIFRVLARHKECTEVIALEQKIQF